MHLLVAEFEAQGYSVWWDPRIGIGSSFDREIERELDEAKCVVVVWSESAVESEWVRAESQEGLDRGILVPVRIDDAKPPLAFRRAQTADLSDAGFHPSTMGKKRFKHPPTPHRDRTVSKANHLHVAISSVLFFLSVLNLNAEETSQFLGRGERRDLSGMTHLVRQPPPDARDHALVAKKTVHPHGLGGEHFGADLGEHFARNLVLVSHCGVGSIDDVKMKVCVPRFGERRAERGHQIVRKILDEADRVTDENPWTRFGHEHTYGGVESRKELIGDVDRIIR